jgi:hypothetical protein
MQEDFLHHAQVVDDGDNAQGILTNRAAQRVNLPNAEDEIPPTLKQGVGQCAEDHQPNK